MGAKEGFINSIFNMLKDYMEKTIEDLNEDEMFKEIISGRRYKQTLSACRRKMSEYVEGLVEEHIRRNKLSHSYFEDDFDDVGFQNFVAPISKKVFKEILEEILVGEIYHSKL